MNQADKSLLDTMIAEYRAGASLREMSGMYYMSHTTVRNWLIHAGVKMRPAKKPKFCDRYRRQA